MTLSMSQNDQIALNLMELPSPVRAYQANAFDAVAISSRAFQLRFAQVDHFAGTTLSAVTVDFEANDLLPIAVGENGKALRDAGFRLAGLDTEGPLPFERAAAVFEPALPSEYLGQAKIFMVNQTDAAVAISMYRMSPVALARGAGSAVGAKPESFVEGVLQVRTSFSVLISGLDSMAALLSGGS